ncbi:MAG: nitroreductase family protein [Spirochaetaceae bacterium]
MIYEMDAQKEGWYEAIARRHSRRKFTERRIEARKLDQIEELIAELNKAAEACRVELVPVHDGRIFSGIRGGYGVIKGAPSYIAFIRKPDKEGGYEQLGYLGQAAILEATRLELGTCWVSGTFDAAAAEGDLELSPEEQLVAVSPLGYPRDGKAFSEKVMSGLAGSGKRKPLEQLCAGEPLGSWPEWAKTAREAGRLAPSAMNRQPWVFRFEADRLYVETDDGGTGTYNRYSKRLDCAIALRHLAVGAQHVLGKPVTVEISDHLRIYPDRRG